MRRTEAFVAALLILVAGCGSDGSKASSDRVGPAVPDADEPAEGGQSDEIDACTLLDRSDVEAEFGDQGTVGAGYHDLFTTVCAWEVGDEPTEPGAEGGTVRLSHEHLLFNPVEQEFESYRGMATDPVDIDGVGVDAFYEYTENETVGTTLGHGILMFRSEGLIFEMSAVFLPSIEGTDARLVSLAQAVVDRL